MEPSEPVEQRAALVTSLVERGFVDVLRINQWEEARDAVALSREDALAVVTNVESYAAPKDGDRGYFHVLFYHHGRVGCAARVLQLNLRAAGTSAFRPKQSFAYLSCN